MKETYRPYSKLTMALRAALIPVCLGMVSTYCNAEITSEYKEDLTYGFKAVSVFLIEILFVILLKALVSLETKLGILSINKDILDIEKYMPDAEGKEKIELDRLLAEKKLLRANLLKK